MEKTIWTIVIILILAFVLYSVYTNANVAQGSGTTPTPNPNPKFPGTFPNQQSACVTDQGQPGLYQNGICVPNPNVNPKPNISSNNLVVSNPAGAYMYYQQTNANGATIYSKSNVSLPVNTSLVLIQTVPNTSTYGKYFYETNYKQYGPKSGFFNADDITKV